MNWFQRFWNNPNNHIVLGTLSGVAATVFPEYKEPLAAAAVALGGAGVMLPEQPKAEPKPEIQATPIAIPQGTLHTADYVGIAQALLAAFAKKK